MVSTALADAVSQALRAPVTLTSMPRMADFATTVESAAPALGWKPGEFLSVYAERRVEAIDIFLDNDLVASGLESLRELRQRKRSEDTDWEGTSEELREVIQAMTPEEKLDKLPKSGKGLIGALRRLAPGLRRKRINVQLPKGQETSGKRRGERVIRITWQGQPEDAAPSDLLEFAAVTDAPSPYACASATGATDEIPF